MSGSGAWKKQIELIYLFKVAMLFYSPQNVQVNSKY